MHGREQGLCCSIDVPDDRHSDGGRRDIQVILIERNDLATVKPTFVIYVTGHRAWVTKQGGGTRV